MNVIRGDSTTIDYSLYGWNRQDTGYFEDNLKKLGNVIKDKSSSIYSNIKNVYNQYHDADIIRRAKKTLRLIGADIRDESVIIRAYEPRRANKRMRSFVMAHKTVQDLYQRGILDGYSDTDYINDPSVAADNYALATDGVYQDDGTCTRYWLLDGVDIDEERLDIDSQVEIAVTWEAIARAINEDVDPTDRF